MTLTDTLAGCQAASVRRLSREDEYVFPLRSLAAVGVATLGLAACGTAGDGDADPGTQSEDEAAFSLVAMAHTFADHSQPWDGRETDGTFTYVAAPCNFDAPVNNVATNLTTLNATIADTSSPASTRMQPLEFEVSEGDENSGELAGTMTMTVCHTEKGPTPEEDPVPDAEKEHIVFGWTADYDRVSEEEITFVGSFDIEETTGPYEGMSGKGELSGYFTCAFANPDGCADSGEFTDLQLVMMGTYQHPDVTG